MLKKIIMQLTVISIIVGITKAIRTFHKVNTPLSCLNRVIGQ